MPVFILLCLTLSYLVQTGKSLPDFLMSPTIALICICLALVMIVLNQFKMIPKTLVFDIFASSTVLLWFIQWKPLFKSDSPIFFFFPVYFALFSAVISLLFNDLPGNMDTQSQQQMRRIIHKSRLKPWLVMLCTLGSVTLPDHYLLFPIIMTLLILKIALLRFLERG